MKLVPIHWHNLNIYRIKPQFCTSTHFSKATYCQLERSRLLKYRTGYHTERKPTDRTVTKTSTTSQKWTLTG